MIDDDDESEYVFVNTLDVLSTEEEEHDIMTFNLRFDTPIDGPNQWKYRSKGVCERLVSYNLDILCLQEATPVQYTDIHHALNTIHSNKYILISRGREYNPDTRKFYGEACSVLFSSDKYELYESGFFWLSETPDVPGSKGWDADCVRIVTWLVLSSKHCPSPFLLVNTHWDHIGHTARMESSKLIKQKIFEIVQTVTTPVELVIFTADMNCMNTSEEFNEMLKPAVDQTTGFRVKFFETRPPEEELATFTGWFDEYNWVLDHVLISDHLQIHPTYTYTVVTDTLPDDQQQQQHVRKMSDHHPVRVKLSCMKRRVPSQSSLSCILQ